MMVARTLAAILSVACAAAALADRNDDPLLAMVMIDEFEWRDTDAGDALAWDAEAWVGKDFDKAWFKSEGERVDGHTESAELQALYSRAIATYWDLQVGWRGDFRPDPKRNWVAAGVQGLAPYFFEIDAAVFLGGSGRTAARATITYDLRLTQRLILAPELELNLYGKDDPEVGAGSGLADSEFGLRLRYEIRREVAPYLGLNWWRLYGDTRDFARAAGESVSDLEVVAGLRAWF